MKRGIYCVCSLFVLCCGMDEQRKDIIDIERRRARGAVSNPTGRFDMAREEVNDGWEIAEERTHFQTQVSEEMARSLITYNKSPDLPFDRSINPYRGCEHGCVYCFARPTHSYLGYSPGLDFETRLIARPNAPEVLEAELRKRSYKVAPIAIGTNTDPYQPIEKQHKIMRRCLEVLQRFHHPVAIVTKGTLIERDIDILGQMAAQGLVKVGVSVTTLDAHVARVMEPRVPTPKRRLATIARLSGAGIPVRIMLGPVVPALTDHEAEALLEAGAAHGAEAASWIMLRLPLEVSELFQEWAQVHFPDRAARILARVREMHGGKLYEAQWGKRMRGEGPYAKMIAQRIEVAMKRHGLRRYTPDLRCDLFRVPSKIGDQLSLFG